MKYDAARPGLLNVESIPRDEEILWRAITPSPTAMRFFAVMLSNVRDYAHCSARVAALNKCRRTSRG